MQQRAQAHAKTSCNVSIQLVQGTVTIIQTKWILGLQSISWKYFDCKEQKQSFANEQM